MPPILLLTDVALSLGGKPLLHDAALAVATGDRIGLVGRNGSGKSSLLKIAAGQIEPDHGERFLQPGTTLRYLPQEPDLSGFPSVLAYVEAGLAPGDEPHRARYLLGELGLSGDEEPQKLSGGEARRAAIARVLAPEPDILLLDEPTNHLDLPAIEWLEAELKGMRSALVLISHDRRFLGDLSRITLWLENGSVRRLDRSFSEFETWRDEILEQEERDRHKLDRKLVAEAHWLRYGVSGRRKRNQGRLRALQDLRRQRREQAARPGAVRMTVTEAQTSGKLVIEAEGIAKSYGGVPVVENFSTRIARGDRIGIVGPNGAGKTTLINMLTGTLEPDSGTVKLGASLEIASLDQRRASLDPAWTLREALTGGSGDTVEVGGNARHVVSYMKDFLFAPEQANTPIGTLSGGERGRLMLARALSQPSNMLVLDEPTNDLDLDTLDLLQEMIADYPGTVLLVSHDRDFLDRTVSSVIVSEGKGRWVEYAGGYSDMVLQRGRGVQAKALSRAAGTPSQAAAAKPAPATGKQAKKLSFHDQHALKTLPARMQALEREVAKLQAQLADPAFYARDPDGFARVSEALAAATAELSAAEDRWLELEMLREELSGTG